MPKDLVLTGHDALIPAPIAAAGEDAVRRFVEFFTATIRNPNTRGAYARTVADRLHVWVVRQIPDTPALTDG